MDRSDLTWGLEDTKEEKPKGTKEASSSGIKGVFAVLDVDEKKGNAIYGLATISALRSKEQQTAAQRLFERARVASTLASSALSSSSSSKVWFVSH